MDGKKAAAVAARSGANRVPARVAEKAAGNKTGGIAVGMGDWPARSGIIPVFVLIGSVSSAQPWLLVCLERSASFLANARSFSCALQL